MPKKTTPILWISAVFLLLIVACNPESERFNSTEERKIRRLVRKQKDSIRVKEDSLCHLEIQAKLDGMVDSLLKVKIDDLKTKMGKR